MGKGTAFICVIAMCICLTAAAVTAREEETSSATKPSSETRPGGEVLKVDSSNEQNSDVQPNPECFCTYDQEESLVNAHVGHKRLKRGDRIMRGQTVTFECRHFGRVLLWKNDFRFFGRATMTCSTCTKWISNDLPTCNYTRRVEPVIGFVEDLKILPGGIVDMRKGESRRFLCSNSMGPPEWDYSDRQGVSVNKTRDDGHGIVMYVSYLDIKQAEDEHSGSYECFKQSEYGRRFGSAFLNIQVNEPICEDPQSPEHGSVMLLGELKVGTLATYSCDPGRKLVGATTTKCLITGQWTFDAPQCLSTCKVSLIQNGEMGRIRIPYRGRHTREEFVKVYAGEEIDSDEALFFRCKVGYSPAEDSKILEGNLLEVTCIDGIWSRNLQCFSTSCYGEPPPTKNGIPVVGSREHGYSIWYDCRRKDMTKVHGNVTCHFGNWIGVVPKCLDGPCYMRDLDFPGLVKPLKEYLESREYFDIDCEYGFRRANSLSKITCNRGKWDPTQNPCVRDTEIDRFVSPTEPALTLPPREVPHSVYVTPSNRQIPDIERSRECFCTYDYENDLVKAKIGGQPLKWGDSITQGETVSIECLYSNLILTWQNGFRFFGKLNMTCNICEKWQRKDLPDCSRTHSSDVIIGSEEDFKISLDGIVHIRRGQTRRFLCSSFSRQPQWNYGGRANVRVQEARRNMEEDILFVTYMDIIEADDNNNGLYICYTENDPGYTSSSLLDLRVDDYVRCHRFPYSSEFIVTYSNHLSVGSIATFRCSSPARDLIGSHVSVCQEDGTWSNPPPSCAESECSIGELSSSIPETVELDMTGVTSEFVPSGSEMRLKCSDNSILQGNSKVLCGEDGKWKLEGRYECVPGCVLNIDPSNHLLIHPVQDSYRFGEFVLLSCPPAEEMSTNVERLMCLGGNWSDSLPFCKKSKKSEQP